FGRKPCQRLIATDEEGPAASTAEDPLRGERRLRDADPVWMRAVPASDDPNAPRLALGPERGLQLVELQFVDDCHLQAPFNARRRRPPPGPRSVPPPGAARALRRTTSRATTS